jgi:hypothetical protein
MAAAAILLVTGVASGEDAPCYSKTKPGLGPQWHAAVGIGPAGFPLQMSDKPSSLETQLGYAGYEVPDFAGAFHAAIEWAPVFWLTVGAELDYSMSFAERNGKIYDEVQRVPGVSGRPGYSMHFLTATAFVQPGLRLIDPCKDEGFEMGIRFSGGGGGMFWTLGDETEAGSVGRMRLAAVYSWIRRGLVISVITGVPFEKIENLGPLDLSHGWTWGWELLLRFGWRWG